MQVRQRHFGGRDQIQIPVAGDLEQVLLELRQVARAAQRVGVDEERRLDFAIAVLARVQIEHEVDQRARQPRAGAASAPRTARRTSSCARSKSRMPSAGPRSQCGFGSKSNARGSPWRRTSDVVVGALARPARSRAAGSAASSAAPCAAARPDRAATSSCLICCAARLVGVEDVRRVLALPLRARDLVARGVLLALQSFDLAESAGAGALRASRAARARRPDRGRGCAGRRGRRRCDRGRSAGSSIAKSYTVTAVFRRSDGYDPRTRVTLRDVHVNTSIRKAVFPAAARHPLPARDQGAAEGDAAAGRQADHPVRRRRGGRLRRRQHHPGHRPRQERDRGSLRRLGRARNVPRGARQDASSSPRSARSRT